MLGNLLWKVIGNRFGAVLMGAVLIGIGLFAFDGTPSCGSRTMEQGDECVTTSRRGGNSTTRSFEEQAQLETWQRTGLLAGGAVLLVVGIVMIVKRATGGKGDGSQTPAVAGGFPPPGPHGYPQQGFPQQGQYGQQQAYPQQGVPQQGVAQHGVAQQQGFPQQGYPQQQGGYAHPQQGHPQQQGYPQQGPAPQQGYPQQGPAPHPAYPHQQYPPQYPAPHQAAPHQAAPHQAAPQYPVAPQQQGYPQQYPPQAHPQQQYPPQPPRF